MPRSTVSPAVRKKRKRVLKRASGYFGNKSRLYRYAKDAVDRAGVYSYRDRRTKKREMRKLWIVRINAACRAHDISYSRFMCGLRNAGIELDRKALSELAIHDEAGFAGLVKQARDANEQAKASTE